MNKKLIRRVIKAIETHPERFNIDSWYSKVDEDGVYKATSDWVYGDSTSCGTTACIAGWASFLHLGGRVNAAPNPAPLLDKNQSIRIDSYAIKAMDISGELGYKIFNRSSWLQHYKNLLHDYQYANEDTLNKVVNKVAVYMLQDLVSGGVIAGDLDYTGSFTSDEFRLLPYAESQKICSARAEAIREFLNESA